MPLTNVVAIVTGGASGIGRATALEFARQGARVAVIDINQPGAEETIEQVRELGGGGLAVTTDVADAAAVDAAVAQIGDELGPVAVLANVAGVMDHLSPAHTLTGAEWARVMAVNASGPYHLCHAVLPGMLERGAGSIVIVASVAGLTGGRAGAAYTASKHAAVGLGRSIAWTYADAGLRCNVICPGAVRTPIMAGVTPEVGPFAERLRAAGPRPRAGQPGEIATIAAFLASPEASYVNGSIIPVDGGWMTA